MWPHHACHACDNPATFTAAFPHALPPVCPPSANPNPQVCKVLRLHFSPLELPILLVSARSGEADALAALDKGVNDFLLKPLRRMELQARINSQVGGDSGHVLQWLVDVCVWGGEVRLMCWLHWTRA
jgi:hypothetical protein